MAWLQRIAGPHSWRGRLALSPLRGALTHRWDLPVPEAIALQEQLAGKVEHIDRLGDVRHVCGIDVDFLEDGRMARAAAVVLSLPDLDVCDYAIATERTVFPYIPGLLSFRETPVALSALERLAIEPDLLLCDGHGVAHPRRFGLASHVGLLAGMASIGVAKTRLIGEYGTLPESRGAWVPLTDHGERVGAVLRTRAGVKPMYVSIGHRVSLPTAIRYVMACTTRYRLPETTRWAHRFAGAKPSEMPTLHRALGAALRKDR
jgi:deoxyribonuclease V